MTSSFEDNVAEMFARSTNEDIKQASRLFHSKDTEITDGQPHVIDADYRIPSPWVR